MLRALELTEKNFDYTHHTINKIRFNYAKKLKKAGEINNSMKEFSILWKNINSSLKSSKTTTDNED